MSESSIKYTENYKEWCYINYSEPGFINSLNSHQLHIVKDMFDSNEMTIPPAQILCKFFVLNNAQSGEPPSNLINCVDKSLYNNLMEHCSELSNNYQVRVDLLLPIVWLNKTLANAFHCKTELQQLLFDDFLQCVKNQQNIFYLWQWVKMKYNMILMLIIQLHLYFSKKLEEIQ